MEQVGLELRHIGHQWSNLHPSLRRDLHWLVKTSHANEQVGCGCHAACIRYKNKMVSWGVNKKKSHPLQSKYASKPERIFLHAEIDAIASFIRMFGSEPLKECELVVVRTFKNGNPALSKPCTGCQEAIKAFKIPVVYHT